MDPQRILQSDLTDIVFDGRNKAYGAYQLRRIYEKHIRNALIVGMLAMLLGVLAPKIYAIISGFVAGAKDGPTIVEVDLKDINLNKPEDVPPHPPPPKNEPPPPPKNVIKYVPPVVKPDAEVTKEEPPVPPKENEDLGNKNVEAKENITTIAETAPAPPPPPPVVEEKPKDDEVFAVVEQQAEFPDGQAALFKWLSQNIKYPAVARENNIQGKVILRFIVEKDGSVNGVTVLRGANELLDKEAVRVVKDMPKWKAGKQRGNAVRSYFTLPVVFKLEG